MNTAVRLLLISSVALGLNGCGGDNPTSLSGTENTPATGNAAIVSAHRGGAAYAPENTLMAMDNAIRLGVDQLETDTQLTSDGVLVLIHDDTLDRTTDCSGAVNALTLAEIQACDAAYWFSPGQATTSPDNNREHPLRGQGITVPTAEALFAQLASMGNDAIELSIEIKDIPGESNFDPAGTAIANVLVPLIQQYGLQDKVIVQSFWPLALDAVKLTDPSIRTQMLTTSEIAVLAIDGLAYATLRGHDILAPNFDAPDFSAEYIQAAHGAGKLVIPYTVDQASDMQAVSDLGVDGLITNFPACLLALQGRRGSGNAAPMGVPSTPDCPD